MNDQDYKNIEPQIPQLPGVYKFLNKEGTIIYVGKAKNLKNRLNSYFGNRKDRAGKTRAMVYNADMLEFTIVETETDALLLENSLIKKFQPKYNVMLKDDKSYSYICIKNEPFPRVFITRRVIRDGSSYFGPYTSKGRIKNVLELVKQLFPLRTCAHSLTPENIQSGKFKVCLEYHIKNCKGGCEGFESAEDYHEKINQIKNILRGNFKEVRQHFELIMENLAANLRFEEAQIIKDKLVSFENYQHKSTVVSTSITDVDVFSIQSNDKEAYVNYLKIVNGAIIQSHTQELIKNLDRENEDILEFAIPQLRDRFNSIATEIILPFKVQLEDTSLTQTIPLKGDKRKLLDLSEKNVKYYFMLKEKQALLAKNKVYPAERILTTLKEALQMDRLPLHLECFDNSNLQGNQPVASCVVFKNAKPSKKDYRHFHIKTVIGPDDFASMEEVVGRRYSRLLKEKKTLPQLIVIDGGKGQLSAAVKALEKLNILDQVTVIGIAKKLEEIFFPGDPIPLYIDKKSEALKIIQQARNEAHRFAITFHRNLRSKSLTGSQLTEIDGIGKKTAEKLLNHFGSVKKIKEATEMELLEIAGKSNSQKIIEYFNKQRLNP
ncbi:MAG: excinuclease ABC subunit UvrC [Saprospiraceae bacterium]|jgi:excinuclease ABC subunit C